MGRYTVALAALAVFWSTQLSALTAEQQADQLLLNAQ